MNIRKLRVLFLLLITSTTIFSCITDHSIEPGGDEQNELLFRKWDMLNMENGVDSLRLVGTSTLLFSKDGSFTTTAINGTYIETRYWKWDGTSTNRMIYRNNRGNFEDYNYIEIRKLTADSLKITVGKYGPTMQFSFVPVK